MWHDFCTACFDVKAQLSQNLGQGLNLTPQLLQSIRLLQLPSHQLELEVQQALETNPMLELADIDDAGEIEVQACEELDTQTTTLEVAGYDEIPEFCSPIAGAKSLAEGNDDFASRLPAPESTDYRVRLLESLALTSRHECLPLAAWWLDHTDDKGYLEDAFDALCSQGSTECGATTAKMTEARNLLLYGERPGVTAQGLTESLLAQLQTHAPSKDQALARLILQSHSDLLADSDIDALCNITRSSHEAVLVAIGLIRTLAPFPVEEAPPSNQDYIYPDVMTWFANGEWHVALCNQNIPAVRVSPVAEQVLGHGKAGASELRNLLEDARWLVRGLAMRNDTLLRTARVLVKRQSGYLSNGEEAIVPLTLHDVATEIQMHESTISRVTTGKYIQTPRGPMELKNLFAARLDGAQVSGLAVRAMVKRMIDSEPAHAPLADATIATMLARNGIRVARRTVAKYRDQLHIGTARNRTRPVQTGTY